MYNPQLILDSMMGIGREIVFHVHDALQQQSIERLSSVYAVGSDDLIYQLDRDVEDLLVPPLEKLAHSVGGIRLIAEGLNEEGALVFPDNLSPAEAAILMIIDPIDGTRGIMYDKRSAFFLAAAGENKPGATLKDLEVAVMTEIPTSRSFLSDTIWAVRNKDKGAFTLNLNTRQSKNRLIKPSGAKQLYGGFGQVSRFFPPGREVLAAIEERMIASLYPDAPEGHTIVFEDQYISSGGQLYELLVGHDRFIADVRAALFSQFKKQKRKIGHQCHPYDLCAHLIGETYGVIVTGIDGGPLNAPLDTTTPVDWIGYANANIRKEVEPVLQRILREYNLV